jgi:ribosomal protein S18 acetylase RimI-like enzyme
MSYQTTVYDAFTGISPMEKNMLVSFLHEHCENADSPASIREAVEYALKTKPSFGGFILVVRQRHQILAAIVANRTGMEGYSATNIFVYAGFHPECRSNETLIHDAMQKAIGYADGDIAMHVEPNNPALKLYQKLGFSAQYLELRLNKKSKSIVA